MRRYVRPLMQTGLGAPDDAVFCGWCWFTHVEILSRTVSSYVAPVAELTIDERARFSGPWDIPRIMGILNSTPDSFSDGGAHAGLQDAIVHGLRLAAAGADIIDVGGESTRPGAEPVPSNDEITRTVPVIRALREAGVTTDISIDTRKAPVAQAALDAGATMVNDVSGFTFDPDLAFLCAAADVSVCVMHSQGDPQTMQKDPHYEDVLLDVYDFLAERIEVLWEIGVSRKKICVDPGIGFGKTLQHNLAILNRISLFHGLGVPILLGPSRKKFIGTLAGVEDAARRDAGSIGVALAALSQGTQVIRAHNVSDHAQAIALWRASVAHL